MYVHHLNYGPPKVSGPGIASCVLAGVAIVFAAAAAVVTASVRLNGGGGPPTTDDYMLGFAMLGSVCGGGILGFAGVVTGIIGLSLPNRRKRVALVGLIANAALLAFVLLVAVI